MGAANTRAKDTSWGRTASTCTEKHEPGTKSSLASSTPRCSPSESRQLSSDPAPGRLAAHRCTCSPFPFTILLGPSLSVASPQRWHLLKRTVLKLWQAPHCWCIAKTHTRYGVFLQDLKCSPETAVTLQPGLLWQMGLIRCAKPYKLSILSLTSLPPTAQNFIHNPYFTDLCETWSFNKRVLSTSY